MSHFSNIQAILSAAKKYDVQSLVDLAESDPIRFADDVAFLITSLLYSFPTGERKQVVIRLMNQARNEEVLQLELDLK